MGNSPRTSRRRLAALFIAFGLIVPAAAPASVFAGPELPRERGSGPQRGALLVRLRSTASDARAASAVAAAGGTEIGRLDEVHTRVVKVPPGQADRVRQRLLADPDVLSVEHDGEAQATLVPHDPMWSKQWYARKVGAPSAWNVTTGAKGIVVAVLDTGVDGNHPDLKGRLVTGWNFHGNNSNTFDDGNHGTPAAGIIAGAGNNGVGIAGLCWKCRIMPVKVLNSAGSGSWSNIAAGIIWATNKGADVINMSLGGATGSAALRDAVKYAVNRGVVVVAAAGNSGSRSQFYPAAYPYVISVAATTSADRLYNFSNRGSWVDIAAPGCTWSAAPKRKWREFCGTSAAAPVVSGVAALVLSRTPGASRAAVEKALKSTSVRFGSLIGGGRVNASAAVRKLGQTVAPDPTATPKPTPKPTPAPTATPKPTPAPTATPKPTQSPSDGIPRNGEVTWEDELWSSADRDSRWFEFGRHVSFELTWDSWRDLRVEIDDASGRRVYTYDDDGRWHSGRSRDEFALWLPPGRYRLTVSCENPGETDFRVEIAWHD